MKHLKKHLEEHLFHLAGAAAHKLISSCEAQPQHLKQTLQLGSTASSSPPHCKQLEESELFPLKQGFKHSIA